jgi:hypothetical protein
VRKDEVLAALPDPLACSDRLVEVKDRISQLSVTTGAPQLVGIIIIKPGWG